MNNQSNEPKPAFDAYAEAYDRALDEGISVSGENKNYFAKGRAAWLSKRLQSLSMGAGHVLDFGCGTGSATPFLLKLPYVRSVLGVDVSARSLEVATSSHGSKHVSFTTLADCRPDGSIDLAYCNGVFHHIPPSERSAALDCISRFLRPGGVFSFWENNPWNPGTRYVMSRIPFDRDAITLSPPEARRLLQRGGFEILRTDFLFIFFWLFSWLRAAEPLLSSLPLGAQYHVFARKPKS